MADVAADLKTWSTTAASNSPSTATTVGTGLAPNLQEIQKVVRQDLAHVGSDIASAGTTDIGAVAGKTHTITGTTTITAFGTVSAGIEKTLIFSGALVLTHNATSLILPGGVNITTATGDVGQFVSLGSGNWRCVSFFPSNAGFVPAGAMLDFGGDTVPSGYLACDGSNVSRTTYARLFAAISTTWGVGDGSTTFAVPDSRRRVAVGSGGTGTATLDDLVGSTGGEETHTLTAAESGLPGHGHTASGTVNTEHVDGQGNGNTVMESTSNNADGTVPVAVTVNNVAAANASSAHNLIQPSYVVTKIIKI